MVCTVSVPAALMVVVIDCPTVTLVSVACVLVGTMDSPMMIAVLVVDLFHIALVSTVVALATRSALLFEGRVVVVSASTTALSVILDQTM